MSKLENNYSLTIEDLKKAVSGYQVKLNLENQDYINILEKLSYYNLLDINYPTIEAEIDLYVKIK